MKDYLMRARVSLGNETVKEVVVPLDTSELTFVEDLLKWDLGEVEIEDAHLWYPLKYGDQPLYSLELTLVQGGSRVVASK